MTKVWRTKLPYLGLAASALMALIARQSMEGLSQPGAITAPSYFTASINMSTTVIIPIFATIFAAMLVAAESSRGTLRTVLTRPITRADFLTAKLLMGSFYLLLLFAANIIPALLIASSYPLRAAFDSGVTIPGYFDQLRIFSLALALTFLPQLATVCFGFLISVWSVNVATAVGLSVGLLLSLQPIKHWIRFGEFDLEPWLFSSYYDKAMGIADSKAGGIPEVWGQSGIYLLIATSLISMAVFIFLSYRSFLKRDLNY